MDKWTWLSVWFFWGWWPSLGFLEDSNYRTYNALGFFVLGKVECFVGFSWLSKAYILSALVPQQSCLMGPIRRNPCKIQPHFRLQMITLRVPSCSEMGIFWLGSLRWELNTKIYSKSKSPYWHTNNFTWNPWANIKNLPIRFKYIFSFDTFIPFSLT